MDCWEGERVTTSAVGFEIGGCQPSLSEKSPASSARFLKRALWKFEAVIAGKYDIYSGRSQI
jgi:hypothetical protein